MNEQTDVVERLHVRLTDAIRRSRRDPGAAVSVSEIYQELVPYRDVRDEVGFSMNADYEHTLLRLLAGEGGYARLEPHTARDAIRDELCLPNPNVGMYRDFAGCDVFVRTGTVMDDILDDDENTDGADGADGGDADGGQDWRALEPDHFASNVDEDTADVISDVVTFSMVEDEPEGAGPEESDEGGGTARSPHCAYCDSELPSHRAVRFCPYCGADQTTRPCTACGESLEPGWTFCVACGSGQDPVAI